MILTIFTPTYNRAYTLSTLYDSLCRQSCKDFEWLIVDDGSKDNTSELVKKWIAENKIPIRYIYQNNQGMHGAHNTAYRNITTELNTCIDSDDYMPDDAVAKIINFWKRYGSDQYAGIIGLDQSVNGDLIGTGFSPDCKATTLTSFYEHGGRGDKKLVYRTAIINQYPEYPIFEGEHYVGLAYKYMLIDCDYQLLTMNEPLVIVDYQPDGSSANMYNHYWNNPRGFAFYRKTEMICASSFRRCFMSSIHYVASSIISCNKKYIKEAPRPLMVVFATPLGLLLYFIIRYKVRRGKFSLKNYK